MKVRKSMALGLAAACIALSAPGQAKQTTISWSTWLGGEQLKEYKDNIALFEKQNPNIKVKVVTIGDYAQYISKILLMFVSGTGPDVMHTTLYSSDDLIAKNLVKDVTSYARTSIKFNEYTKFSNTYQRKGRIIGGLESHTQVYPVFFSNTLFRNAGLPTPNDFYYKTKNWDLTNFLTVAKKLTADLDGNGKLDRFGFTADSGWETGWYPWVVAFGGTFWNEAAQRIDLTGPKTMEAIRFWASLTKENKCAPIGNESATALEKTGMWLTGSWQMNHYSFYQKKVDWDIGWPPKAPGMPNVTYASPGADGIVYKGTKHPQEAWKLVQFFLSKDCQMKKAKSRLVVPVMKAALNSDVYLQAPPANMRVIGEMMDNPRDLPVFQYFLDAMAIVDKHMNLALQGKKSADAACRDAEEEANKFLVSRRKKK